MCASYVGQQWSIGLEVLVTHLALESLHLQVLYLPFQLNADVNDHRDLRVLVSF